jgi:preprotein translocase subunit YajC
MIEIKRPTQKQKKRRQDEMKSKREGEGVSFVVRDELFCHVL